MIFKAIIKGLLVVWLAAFAAGTLSLVGVFGILLYAAKP